MVTGNLMGGQYHEVDRREFRLMMTRFKLYIPEQESYFYPDLAVFERDTVQEWFGTRPVLWLEVIEPRSEFIDRCVKVQAYLSIPTLQMYLIAEQEYRHVTVFKRNGENWHSVVYTDDGVVPLPFVNTQVTLTDLYGGVFDGLLGTLA